MVCKYLVPFKLMSSFCCEWGKSTHSGRVAKSYSSWIDAVLKRAGLSIPFYAYHVNVLQKINYLPKVPRTGIWYWVVVSIFFIFTPTWGHDPIWLFFQMGWNHQLGFLSYFPKNYLNWSCFLPSCPSSSLRWGRRNSCKQSTCSVSDWMVDRIRTCWNEFCWTRNEHVTTTRIPFETNIVSENVGYIITKGNIEIHLLSNYGFSGLKLFVLGRVEFFKPLLQWCNSHLPGESGVCHKNHGFPNNCSFGTQIFPIIQALFWSNDM